MKLTAKVTGDHRRDGKLVIDGNTEDGGYFFKLPNRDGFKRDDELVLLILTKEQTASVFDFADKYDSAAATLLADQLRPDEPPPFMVTTEAMPPCSECKHDDPLDERGRCTNTTVGSDNMDVDVCGHRCGSAQQPDTADTQEFVREGQG